MADQDEQLLTLTEVSERTNISMPTLQRYKKQYQDQIPSRGSGRTQRYPVEALEVFTQLKEENMKKRGRPRKNKAAEDKPKTVRRPPAPRAKPAESEDNLITLKEIGEQTGISYPTLLRYVKSNIARIPHVGEGRGRRYPPEAIDVFRTLRQESRRGRKAARSGAPASTTVRTATRVRPAAASPASSGALEELQAQLKELQKSHMQLQRHVQHLEKELAKPFKVVLKR
ncbi:MAG: helix-turn-helix domain-containing protein [Acidobacteriota bacterium]